MLESQKSSIIFYSFTYICNKNYYISIEITTMINKKEIFYV